MTRKEFYGALAWIFALQFFVVQGIVQAAWTTPFSLAHNMISDLARVTCGPLARAPGIDVACSPWHALMNASIALNGVLIPLGAILTRRVWPADRLARLALTMIAMTAPGHFMVALWPSDTGPAMHLIGAASILLLGNPGMVLAGFATHRHHRPRRLVSMMLGFTGIAGTLLFVAEFPAGIGLGGMERVAFYPLSLWCGMMGFGIARAQQRMFRVARQ